MEIGDVVIYVHNIPFDDNYNLLKRPTGVIRRFFISGRGYGKIAVCVWTLPSGGTFEWNVPITQIKINNTK
jgi:hypothetical protein